MNFHRQNLIFYMIIGLALGLTAAVDPPDTVTIAHAILDDDRPQAEREAMIHENPKLSADLIAAMTSALPDDAKEEYRRIPWIWRVAIAAGKRNEIGEIKRILAVSIPKEGMPLRDWEAVVVGGGLINGITQAGGWPADRLAEALKSDPILAKRFRRALLLGSVMADDPKVHIGTRYDALRLLGVEPWDLRGAQLIRYQTKGIHPELQMGAVSALGDIREPADAVAQVLISGLPHYNKTNRELALDALMRNEARVLVLLDALTEKTIKPADLGPKRIEALQSHASESIRRRAAALLTK